MRGGDVRTEALFSYLSCETRVPKDHPLRPIRTLVDQALGVLSPTFDQLYAQIGRPSIAPEKLLRALLLQALYSVRSERQLMEQLDYNLLFRWFVGLAMDAPIWDFDRIHQEPRTAASPDFSQGVGGRVVWLRRTDAGGAVGVFRARRRCWRRIAGVPRRPAGRADPRYAGALRRWRASGRDRRDGTRPGRGRPRPWRS